MNNNSKAQEVLIRILRSFISFVVFLIIANVSLLIFNANLFGMEGLTQSALDIVNCIFSIFSLFIFQSVYFTLIVKNRVEKRRFLEIYSGKVKSSLFIRDTLKSFSFYSDIAVIVCVSAILPVSFTFGSLKELVFASVESEVTSKIFTLLVALPFIVLVLLFSHTSARKEYLRETSTKQKDTEIVESFKAMIPVVLAFAGASLIIPWFIPGFITLWNLFGGMIFLWLLLIIAVVVATIVAVSYVRALLKCNSFVKKLNKLCAGDSYKITFLKKPHLSVIKLSAGVDFRVHTPKNDYDCKIVSGVFRNSPLIFSDKGNGLQQITFKLFGAELFHILSKFEFGFESEHKKAILILPAPKNIYASVNNSPPRPADTGEKVGSYTLYSANGFLNMIDREL